MKNGLLPMYDGDGRTVLDEHGDPATFTEEQARKFIGQSLVTVRHGRGKNAPRYLVLRVSLKQAKAMGLVTSESKAQPRIPAPEPYIVSDHVAGNRVYSHVAHRCSAAAPTRPPVNAGWM